MEADYIPISSGLGTGMDLQGQILLQHLFLLEEPPSVWVFTSQKMVQLLKQKV